ncbi:aldehyde dehydrogenase (NADP(+)) [Sphingomonas aerophila]|jgi:alpha-ketoglutaric semialdehyde dehydrogenase|uniref:NADP-dependent aldehyde dehydrogenase n=1 Tax=Sphingomonas aerophila TaxID=1344948 RepID=A0A7W9BG87_9SPHN|nr:aldehyde dehydrogenase (NADP(+)) [Sphingomonas aerophila]MBB5716685.1 NADP-dependent aldehyde dehydrogenase [Sphingomonas aerophila]
MDGAFLIGRESVVTTETFQAFDPSTDQLVEPAFSVSTPEHVARACQLADEAFDTFRDTDPEARAAFLEAVAANIEALGDALVQRAVQESGLPVARLTGERGRTVGQLRLFAKHVRAGRYAQVVVDQAQPERQPMPRSDLRQRRVGVGPVAVFGASNFPLAFSVAGGDTAAALAAGCPVVCKGHPAHPGTSVMVAGAIRDAIASCGLPDGVFSLVQGPANELGAALVTDPRIKAVGFTGSRAGGLALVKLAQERAEPIPVYAEMSSINPVILFPAALANRGEALAKGYVGSLTMGAGQFCTNPGIVLAIAGPELDRFSDVAAEALGQAQPQVMLTRGIHSAYSKGVEALAGNNAVTEIARGAEGTGCNRGRAALFTTDAQAFLADPELAHEVFGASSLVIRANDIDEVATVLRGMEGQLTATLHLDEGDEELARPLMPLLERKAGRILANGWPTGVEVSDAMVHGGPFPATSDPRSTSVGTAAIERFLRPVCYQDLPDALLPRAVQHGNPLGLPRLVDGAVEA